MIASTWKNTGRSSKPRWASYALGRYALCQTEHFLARLKGVRLSMNVKMAEPVGVETGPHACE
jgi:hypothetical protein